MRSISEIKKYSNSISRSKLSIYDPIEIGDPELWVPSPEMEQLLNRHLVGLSLAGLPLRTRSKVLKSHVCTALGYPIPTSFRKTKPRFPGQLLDTYIQKSNNLQIWNDELQSTRRYAIIRVSDNDIIEKIKVVTGDTLSLLDTTGTLTQKYQASLKLGEKAVELITPNDTQNMIPIISVKAASLQDEKPTDIPDEITLLAIRVIFDRLKGLVGNKFSEMGSDQERRRAAHLHRLVCQSLGYKKFSDDGRFPDIRHQILEVKLQTSPTIDLGLVLPSSTAPLDIPKIGKRQIKHCDVRYAVFYGSVDNKMICLSHLFVSTGEGFLKRFIQFQGKVLNKKLQIPLPKDFFSS